jgi:hypothetical protein
MREGDYRIDPKQMTVDFLLAQVRSSNINNWYMGTAIKAIERMDKDGVFEPFGDEILSLEEAFCWMDTPEGYEFWSYVADCVDAEQDVRRVSNG